MSLRDVEAAIGNLVTAQAIGKYERCESMPSSGVLIALAEALDVSVDYLAGEPELTLEGVGFRKKKITSPKEQAQVEAKTLHLMERYLLLEDLLGLSSAEWDQPREAPYPVCEIADAERAARSLREYWDLGIDPIPNLVELLEERGIKVIAVDLDEKVDGLMGSVHAQGKEPVPVIVLRKDAPGERQRFTLAHELGHLVLQPLRDVDEETAANRFAGAFLMPAEGLWEKIGKHRRSIGWSELFDLKLLFLASVQAITYRCKDVGIFNEALYRKLFIEFGKRGWRKRPYPEPHPIDPEEPRRFERLCYRAVAEQVISEAKAGELLGITVPELDRRMEDPDWEPQ